jgi:hypothetical protein
METGTYKVNLHFDHAEIQAKCAVKCTGGESIFEMTGHLRYIPQDTDHGYMSARSEGEFNTNSSAPTLFGFQLPNFDGWNLLSFFFNPWTVMLLIAAVVVGLIVLWIVIRAHPVFNAWKMVVRIGRATQGYAPLLTGMLTVFATGL